jgi:hypothetical protein
MHSSFNLYAQIAFFSGLSAISISLGFVHLFVEFREGSTINWYILFDALQSWELLIGSVILALLFQYGLPVFCASAFFFGIPTRKLWKARIGMAAAVFSLVFYGLFLWALYNFVR